jgi:hypothetical protein
VQQLGRVLGELGEVTGAAQLPDQAGGVPGRAPGELVALEQHDVADTELGQVVRDRTSDHPAADDFGVCAGGNGIWHGWTRRRADV